MGTLGYSLLFQPRCMGKRPWQLPRRTICISKSGRGGSESPFQVNDKVFAQLTCTTISRTIELLFVLIKLHIAATDGIVFRCSGTTSEALEELLIRCWSGHKRCHRSHKWSVVYQHPIPHGTRSWRSCSHIGRGSCGCKYEEVLGRH